MANNSNNTDSFYIVCERIQRTEVVTTNSTGIIQHLHFTVAGDTFDNIKSAEDRIAEMIASCVNIAEAYLEEGALLPPVLDADFLPLLKEGKGIFKTSREDGSVIVEVLPIFTIEEVVSEMTPLDDWI